MAEKRKTDIRNTLLEGSSKRMMTSTLANPSLTSSLLSSPLGGTASTTLNLSSLGTSSLSLKPSLLTSGISLTSTSNLGLTKSKLEIGLHHLSLQSPAKPKERKVDVEKKSSPRGNVEKKRIEPVKKSSATKRSVTQNKRVEKKKKVESSSGVITASVVKQYTIDAPSYQIKCDNEEEYMQVEMPDFIPPDRDLSLVKLNKRSLTDVVALKRGFINCISGSLISQPKFSETNDPTRQVLMESVTTLVDYDPEFLLKAALYSRKELNIRTTSNFLLALASNIAECKQYLKKYYNASIALPSDWIEVAMIFQTLEANDIKAGSLPAALRKVMISKFAEFDEYQLAKYNKESSGKKKNAKNKKAITMKKNQKRKNVLDSDSSDSEEEEDNNAKANRQLSDVSYEEKITEADLRKQRFTIKQLIRKLHITSPVAHIMCIIGKKYPDSLDKFYQSRLPGTFEEERAGKRMKLPIPETWETQVSLKGNKAKTWEDLIDHKKLPFMAMLRNLRNVIKAGISEKHHTMIIRRLCDKRQVVNSKQFPFRFFSAYVVLHELEEAYEQNQSDIVLATEAAASGVAFKPQTPTARGRGGRGRGGRETGRKRAGFGAPPTASEKKKLEWWELKKQKKQRENAFREVPYDKKLLQRYFKALDTSVKIATTYNVQPIKGRTIILCDVSDSMDVPCSSARGLGKPRTLKEISALMSLMCQHACESCTFIIFNEKGYKTVHHQDDLILSRLEKLLASDNMETSKKKGGIPYDVLFEAFRDRVQIDNLLIFTQDIQPSSPTGQVLNDFLCQYRHSVNPNLLFVGMTFSSPKPGFDTSIVPGHENDIYISGYSDAILRFIAERGDSGLLQHVDKIDDSFQLRPMPKATGTMTSKPMQTNLAPEKGLYLTVPKPSWHTVRVFISSTFRDMHGERDLLTRFVFPELRSIGQKHFVNIYEVDLRWGITEDETKSHRTVALCLEEVSRCQLFVGLLGDRYGWTPDTYQVPDSPEYDWVRQYPPGASVTELEMYAGAMSKIRAAQETAFFFLRDNSFLKDVPPEFVQDFKAEDEKSKSKMQALKSNIRNSGLQVYDNYSAHWGGYVDNKPMVSGLENFGANMLNTLVNAVKKLCPDQEELTEEVHLDKLHWAAVEKHCADFVGRQPLLKDIIDKIAKTSYGVIGLIGKLGSGKTALMSATIKKYMQTEHAGDGYNVIINISGAAAGSNNLAATLRRLFQLLNSRFALGYTLPEDFKNLVVKFEDLLSEAGNICTSKLVIFLDGVDAMENSNQPSSLEWLPSRIPDNVVFVLTAVDGEPTAKSLKRVGATEINVGALDIWDKADIVRQTLAKHRKALNESGFGNEMKLLMLKKDAHNPLFLKLACEELRVFGVFEKIADKLKSLPHTTAQMLQEILIRLEEEHGKELICLCLSLLACTRDGLYVEELYELVNWSKVLILNDSFSPNDLLNTAIGADDKMAPISFIYVTRSIMSFLNPSSSWSPMLSLGNAEIRTAVRLRYMKSMPTWEGKLHKLLAGYYWLQADPSGDRTWKGQNARAFAQLPYHLACAHVFPMLESVLCSHEFIQAKSTVGLAAGLLDDFELRGSGIKEKEAAKFLALPRVKQYRSFISRNIEILVSFPSLELQQAFNEVNTSIPYTDANNLKLKTNYLPPHMVMKNKPDEENQCYRTLSSLKVAATCIKVSPNGTCIATGSQDAIVRLYDKNTGKELKSFMGHSDTITDVCFVNSRVLCSASADTTLSVWDTEFGHRIHILKEHKRRVDACAADPSGQTIASGGWDGMVTLWNASNGSRVFSFEIGSPVNSVHFHPEVELLAVGSWDSKIRVFNTLHQKRVAILNGHNQSVRDVVFSNNGNHLASADIDGDVKIWDSKKGVVVGSVKGHSEPISKILFSPSGKELVTASNDHQIKVWSGNLGIPFRCLATEKLGPATSVVISSDGRGAAVGYHTGIVRLYSMHTGVKLGEVKVCSSPIRALIFHDGKREPDKYLLAGCDDSFIQVVDTAKMSNVCKLTGHTKPILCLASMSNLIVSGGEDCSICIYKEDIEHTTKKEVAPYNRILHHTAPVTSLCISQSSEIISASRDSSVCFHDISVAVKLTKSMSACHADWINAVSLDHSSQMVATASNDFNIKLWDQTDTTKEKCTLTGHGGAVNTLAFDHGYIVSGSSDSTLKVWSHKGVEITTLQGHKERVNSCSLYTGLSHNDNKEKNVDIKKVFLASAGDDGDVWLWRPFLANHLSSLTGHSDRVLSVSADKEGLVTSCSLDGTIKMWKPQLLEDANVAVHDAPVTFLAQPNRDVILITGSRDGVVKVWKYVSSSLEVKLSFQAHEKSVNCGTFLWDSSTVFVTGGNDNQLIKWEIIDNKHGFDVREKSRLTTDGPVTCVHYTIQPSLGAVFYSTLFGTVNMWKASGETLMMYRMHPSCENVLKSWITSMELDKSNPLCLKCGTTSNSIEYVTFDPSYKSSQSIRKQTVDNAVDDESKFPPNWITCVTEAFGRTIAGDSSGQIFLSGSRDSTIKVHKSDITAIAVHCSTLFTASKDATIKIWDISSEDGGINLQQIGQFFCAAPITDLRVILQSPFSVSLAAGDQLGNIHQLSWQSGGYCDLHDLR